MIDRNGPLPQEKTTAILKQIVEALAVAHKSGIIHRDIKPDNIMITQAGQVKVTDFGLAKLKDAPTITKTKSPMGTVSYMSPELVQGEYVDQRTDLWSLGVVLFEMLTGEMPFKGDSDVAIMYSIIGDRPAKLIKFDSQISNSLLYICATLLEKDPALRYKRAEDVLNDLQRTIKASKTKLTLRKVRKNYQLFSIVFVLLFVILFFANYYYQTRINIPAWLKGNVKPVRLTNETGVERGKISADGKYLAFHSENDRKLYVRNISTEETFAVCDSISGQIECPAWSPDNKQIAFIAFRYQMVFVYDLEENEIRTISRPKTGVLNDLDWSNDNTKLVTNHSYRENNNDFSSILVIDNDGKESKTILTRQSPKYLSHPVWHPNSKQIIFYDYDLEKRTKEIRSINVQTGNLSPPLYSLKYTVNFWCYAGICCSPDAKYLVFPEEYNKSVELVALAINKSCTKSNNRLIALTNFAGIGEPFWPSFSKDGALLCYGLETDSRIISIQSLDISHASAGERSSLVSTFTNRVNFDANWSLDGRKISFLSIRAPKVLASALPPDIYIWEKKSEKLTKIDGPNISFQKLDFHPDDRFLTFIYNRALWKLTPPDTNYEKIFPFDTSDGSVMIASYDWGATSSELFAIIFHDEKEITKGQLLQINLKTKNIKILAENLNFKYDEVRYSPQSELLALRSNSADDYLRDNFYIINPKTGVSRTIGSQSAIVPQGQISWTADGKHVLYGTWSEDGVKFHHYLLSLNGEKTLITGPAFENVRLKKFPGQISPQGNDYLFTTQSSESDIWMIGKK
jgi:serine/threonine protein kinase